MSASVRTDDSAPNGQRARTDLVVRALEARLDSLRRRRPEVTRADLRGSRGDKGADDAHVRVARLDRAAGTGLQEVKRRARRSRAVHLLVRERVEAQLQVLVRQLLRPLTAFVHGRRLVVDDLCAVRTLVHPIPSPDDAVLAEHEREALLDEVRRALALLVLMEPTERVEPRLKSLALVLRADESLREPGRTERRLKILERGLLPLPLAPQVVADGLMQRKAIDHRRARKDWNPQHVLEAIEQRAAPVVLDVRVRDGEHVVGAERGERRVGLLRRDLEALQLFVRREPRREPFRLAAQRLADEAARAEGASAAVIDRVGEEEGVLRPGHRDIHEPTLLGDVRLTGPRRRLHERVGERQGVATARTGHALVGAMHEEDDTELKALRLVDRKDIHALRGDLEVRGDGIVPRLAKQLEIRHEERRAVGGQRAGSGVDEPEEFRDVLPLLLSER